MELLSRWYHRPRLHVVQGHEEKKPAWIELFYDLIFVAALIQLGNGLSSKVSVGGVLLFAALFYFLWVIWRGFTFFYNRFTIDDALQRLIVFVQMFAVGGMAVSIARVFEGEFQMFLGCFVLARATVAAMFLRTGLEPGDAGVLGRFLGRSGLALAALWGATILLPAPWTFLAWALLVPADFVIQGSSKVQAITARNPADAGHLKERFGLLTIIVLGEMFVKVLSEVSEKGATPNMLITAGFGLMITCSIWWLYFDDVLDSQVKRRPSAAWVWIYAHYPTMVGITGVGVAIKKAVFFEPGAVASVKYRVLLCGILALTFVGMAVIDSVTERQHSLLKDAGRVRMRAISALSVLLLIPAGGFMSSTVFLGIVAAACVAQVLFDLSMAPKVAIGGHEAPHLFTPSERYAVEAAEQEAEDEEASAQPKRRDLSDVIRVGTPDAYRSDLYVHLLEGSWIQLFVGAAGVFLASNIFFAALFLLQEGAISGVTNPTFLDSFALSVQTFTTIGYGGLVPGSTFGHVLVTTEAFVGILWVALVTGLVFAKASSPKASVMFSDSLVVEESIHGTTLTCRTANARGSDIVSASLQVHALMIRTSPDGRTFRELVDLRLVRSMSPMFLLSWSAYHKIDEASPLADLAQGKMPEDLEMLIWSLEGHDKTYANTIHAQKVYHPEDIQIGCRFTDIIRVDDNMTTVMNFNSFHQTEEQPEFWEHVAQTTAADSADEDSAS